MQAIQIGPFRISFRPRHFAGGLWVYRQTDGRPVFISQAKAMQWYDAVRDDHRERFPQWRQPSGDRVSFATVNSSWEGSDYERF